MEDDEIKLWIPALVECEICTTRWSAVFPATCEELECPHCGHIGEQIILE